MSSLSKNDNSAITDVILNCFNSVSTSYFRLLTRSSNSLDKSLLFQLSYTGHGCQEIPESLGKFYGSRIQIFDLSYNSLQSLHGLENFEQLTELILDNNAIDDNLSIPSLPHLHTLSVNKNKVRFPSD